MKTEARTNCREDILQAAESIAVELGAAHLTLDAVAAGAGVSKGGLMYHFPTKDALLAAMIERTQRKSREAREGATLDRPAGPFRALEGEIVGQLRLHRENGRANGAMLAVMANSPHLLTDFRREFKDRFDRLTGEHPDPEHAAILLFATYGLCLLELLQLSPIDADQRQAMAERILDELRHHGGESTDVV